MSLTPPFVLLDRYDVSAEIGRGGHAIVYRAHDRVFDRPVAIKLLRDDVLSPDVLARFRQEIQLTARLEHAHILHVYDTGTFEGLPYVVMELASGQTLAERLTREGQLPIADALQITRDVGLALAHAHARRIVHRDVKPENILLGAGGAMLADFGVARVTADQAVQRLTSTGMAVGTLQYMSPEQLCAEPIVDERSDQYALACVLYEMLAGVRPHTSASLEGLRMLRLTAQHAPVSAHRPSVPPEVEEALQVAMAVAPADRYRSVEAFLAAFGAVQTGDMPVPPALGGTASRSTRPSQRGVMTSTPAATRWRGMRRLGVALGMAGAFSAAILWQSSRSEVGNEAAPSALDAGTLTVALTAAASKTDSLESAFRKRVTAELSAWPDLRMTEGNGDVRLILRAQRLSDSVQLRIDVSAPDAGTSSQRNSVHHRVVRMTTAAVSSEWNALIPSMVREALTGRPLDQTPGLDDMPGRSLAVLKSYGDGFAHLRAGALDSATVAFRAARSAEPAFTLAFFWAAQSAAWATPRERSSWLADAEETARRADLHGIDSLLATGLVHLAHSAFPEACHAYGLATTRDPRSFVAWYGLGSCAQLDDAVVPEAGRARFRSSVWGARRAYREALERVPTAELLGALFAPILRSMHAGGAETRVGEEPSSGSRFYALPALIADTFAFFPIDSIRFVQGGAGTVPTTWDAAVRRGRTLVREYTGRWIQRFPDSPIAWYHRAVALELSGAITRRDEPSAEAALDTVERGATSPLLQDRARVARIRLALRRGALDTAVMLARSVPFDTSASGGGMPARRRILAPLAAFAGDRNRLLETIEVSDPSRPMPVRAPLREVKTAALLGDCARLRTGFDALEAALVVAYPRAELRAERQAILVPVLRIAVPCLGAKPLLEFTPSSAQLDSVHVALAVNEKPAALRQLAKLRARRSGAVTASVSWDYLFAESWALLAAGDSLAAVRQIVAGLDGLSSMSVYTLDHVEYAAGLRRSILLLGELVDAARLPPASNDTAAALWRSAAQWVAKGAALRRDNDHFN